jgi:8-oxo-dGTP pyrophosphatase MutT (NUDIX family)
VEEPEVSKKQQSSGSRLAAKQLERVCEKLLLALPGPREGPLDLADFIAGLPGVRDELSRPMTLAACDALITTFARLGLLQRHSGDSVQAVSDDACTFLHSLGQYVRGGLPLLGDWRARGSTPEARGHRNLLGVLENYRVARQGRDAPASRRVDAVAAIIKGKLEDQHVYLLQYNPNWGIPWWIGGIVEKTDPGPEAALRRELEEELGLSPQAIDSVRPFGKPYSYRRMSSRLHALTEYRTRFYSVTLSERHTPEETFFKSNERETLDRDGRTFLRQNSWLSWEQLRGDPNFEALAGDVLQELEARGTKGLNAPHSVRPVESAPALRGSDYWDPDWPLGQQVWLATRVQEFLPVVEEVGADARRDLQTLTDDDSFDAYLSNDPRRVEAQVHALYAALRRRRLHYRLEPWDSRHRRQRVRLSQEVFQGGAGGGCCIDLTCAMASCLYAQGLRPLLVVLEGHALLGYWLEEAVPTPAPVLAWKYVQGQSARIGFVETTCLTLPGRFPFDKACEIARENLNHFQPRFAVDVHACRQADHWATGYRPRSN